VKTDVPEEFRLPEGQLCLISQSHINNSLRGHYCRVIKVSPKSEVAKVELLGDSIDTPVPSKVRKRAGEQINVFVCWLLAVEEIADDN
jgi:hypothetical protein